MSSKILFGLSLRWTCTCTSRPYQLQLLPIYFPSSFTITIVTIFRVYLLTCNALQWLTLFWQHRSHLYLFNNSQCPQTKFFFYLGYPKFFVICPVFTILAVRQSISLYKPASLVYESWSPLWSHSTYLGYLTWRQSIMVHEFYLTEWLLLLLAHSGTKIHVGK